MAFNPHFYVQGSEYDALKYLSDSTKAHLFKSWAVPFREKVFPLIDEEPFARLYDDKASRPETPINVLVGALILKELFDIHDQEVYEKIMFDVSFQYALRTTTYREQPMDYNSLGLFRERNTAYEAMTGVDLIENCILKLSSELAELMNFCSQFHHKDAPTIISRIKKMRRMEVLYTSVRNLVKRVDEQGTDTIAKRLRHYLDENDLRKMIYYCWPEEVDSRTEDLLQDARRILQTCKTNYDQTSEYLQMIRVLKEPWRS
ncbi:MAG: transposase [Bacillota bacterium]|nr:transposase [Bacillota bacterium]